jgi:tetratricopeptide (TPR) repeat protein
LVIATPKLTAATGLTRLTTIASRVGATLVLLAAVRARAQSGASPQQAAASMVCSQPPNSIGLRGVRPSNWDAAEAHYRRGVELQSKDDIQNAEAEFRMAVAQAPMADQFVRKLALVQIERQNNDGALASIRAYVKLCGPTALGWELESELLFKRRLFDAAYEAAQNSLKLAGDNARMHEMLGLIYITKRQNPAASLELQKAADLNPKQPQIRYFLGRTLYGSGRFPEARDQFLACREIQPNYPRALENLGLCYEALQDYAQAFDCYRKAMAAEDAKSGRRNAEPYAYCGRLLLQTGNSEEALPVLRRAVDVSPRSLIANFELGHALLNAGSLKDAEKFLVTAEKLDPKFPRTYYLLGRICEKQERRQEAAEYWATFERMNQDAENREIPLTDY